MLTPKSMIHFFAVALLKTNKQTKKNSNRSMQETISCLRANQGFDIS